MAILVLISLCCAALFALPAHGLIAPQPSVVACEGLHHSFHSVVHKRDHSQRCRALCSGLNYDGDDDGDSNVEESTLNLQQQQQQKQQSQEKTRSNNRNINNDPSPKQIMSLMGTSPRRIFLSLTTSTTIALAANFFGITSNLLSALPEEFAEESGLDSVYPRGDYKRVTVRGSGTINSLGIANNSNSGKCSFLIPKEWVADTGLALAQAQRQARSLDYSMSPSEQQQKSSNVLPDAAYGPPGRLNNQGLSDGDTNVSVIVNNGVKNFSLASLGSDPESAAEVVLSLKVGSRRKLVSAVEERRGDNNLPIYQFEYTVDRGEMAKPLRAISVVAGSPAGDAFVTLTVVSTEEEWEMPLAGVRLRRVAQSFKLV